jgi:hypothetical protein
VAHRPALSGPVAHRPALSGPVAHRPRRFGAHPAAPRHASTGKHNAIAGASHGVPASRKEPGRPPRGAGSPPTSGHGPAAEPCSTLYRFGPGRERRGIAPKANLAGLPSGLPALSMYGSGLASFPLRCPVRLFAAREQSLVPPPRTPTAAEREPASPGNGKIAASVELRLLTSILSAGCAFPGGSNAVRFIRFWSGDGK